MEQNRITQRSLALTLALALPRRLLGSPSLLSPVLTLTTAPSQLRVFSSGVVRASPASGIQSIISVQ